jgi:acetyltransferase-like isoleucine patch superfamily enzyme
MRVKRGSRQTALYMAQGWKRRLYVRSFPTEIVIGRDSGFSGTLICAAQSTHIGDRVMLGANTTVTDTDSHPIDYCERFASHYGLEANLADTTTRVLPVVIEDDVFVGMYSIILNGVTI